MMSVKMFLIIFTLVVTISVTGFEIYTSRITVYDENGNPRKEIDKERTLMAVVTGVLAIIAICGPVIQFL